MNLLLSSKKFWIVIGILLGLASLLLVFQAGMSIGERKAAFACRWADNYQRNFAGPKKGFMSRFPNPEIIESHGAFGRVLRVDPSSLVIKRPDGIERIVDVSTDTEILRTRFRINLSDVQTDEEAVVIGRPTEDGRIRAGLIRILPPRP